MIFFGRFDVFFSSVAREAVISTGKPKPSCHRLREEKEKVSHNVVENIDPDLTLEFLLLLARDVMTTATTDYPLLNKIQTLC